MSEQETVILDFEKTIVEVEEKINHLKTIADDGDLDVGKEIKKLQKKLKTQIEEVYHHLQPWQKAQIARHPARPHCLDYVNALIDDFTLLYGDRKFADDASMVCGIGMFEGIPVAIIGQEKGNDLDTRIKYNFGMARPEGYRKAQRIMEMAEKFKLPILTFVDTAGAYPGVDAEARGQAEAIASSIEKCLQVKTPLIATIIGEGGSGGAIAIAVADKVIMLEHAIYSVISPEGCASILWRSADKTKEATEALHLTAQELKKLGIIDEIVNETVGGAHRNPTQTIENLRQSLKKNLKELMAVDFEKLKQQRTEKFMSIGSQFLAVDAKQK